MPVAVTQDFLPESRAEGDLAELERFVAAGRGFADRGRPPRNRRLVG